MQHAAHQSQDAPSRPPPNDNDTYRMMVLRLDQSEEEVDRHFLQTALNLGINVPQSPRTTLDLVTHDVSTFDISPATPEPSLQSSSQASDSSHGASDSFIGHRGHAKTPSLTADSITSAPSTSSTSSNKSNYVKIKKGFRRISTLRRRKTLGTQVPETLLPLSTSHLPRPALPRALTTEELPASTNLQPHALTTNEPTMGASRRHQIASVSYTTLPIKTKSPFPAPPDRPPPPPREHRNVQSQGSRTPSDPSSISSEVEAARRRSTSHPTLKKLRTTQLQEQLRFISFQASQNRLMRTSHLQAKRDALTSYKSRQAALENAHAEALTSLEHRQLSAEVDLRKGLEVEKKACDTKLKHMQAYCNPRNQVAGMPRREVTKADYQQLEQQYHLRNTMDNLHASKINVLREKQAKQLERVAGKQEAELDRIENEFDKENLNLDMQFRSEESALKEEFAARRRRLVRRWNLAEAIERRKLEIETGDDYGRMPSIEWGEDVEDGIDSIDLDGLGSESSDEKRASDATDAADAGEAEVVYGSMNMI